MNKIMDQYVFIVCIQYMVYVGDYGCSMYDGCIQDILYLQYVVYYGCIVCGFIVCGLYISDYDIGLLYSMCEWCSM